MNLKIFLEIELAARKKRNSQYSLRAFAKFLSIGEGTLSKILSGKQDPTLDTKKKILSKFEISEELANRIYGSDHRFFYTNKNVEGDSEVVSERLLLQDFIFEFLNKKSVSLQDLIQSVTSTYPADEKKIMGVVDHLINQKIIEELPDGKLRPLFKNQTSLPTEEVSSEALKKYQELLMDYSRLALKKLTVDSRSHTSIVTALPQSAIQEVKEEIREFRRRVNQIIIKHDEESETEIKIYGLQVGLFPFIKKD